MNSQSWSTDPWAKALFTFSHKVETKPRSRQHKLPQRTTGTGALRNAESTTYAYSLADTAPQLANPMEPLRDRDRAALRGFFAHDQMAAIEADILHRLSYLVPEPPWEVEPYEFLREFL
ncbi:MAG: hypothetical protein ACFCVB_19480 [Nodosilinea sp.]